LYSMLISCAASVGIASRSRSFPIGSVPRKSLSFSIIFTPFIRNNNVGEKSNHNVKRLPRDINITNYTICNAIVNNVKL